MVPDCPSKKAFQEAVMRKIFVAVVTALVLGWATPSRAAETFAFDPDGSGAVFGSINAFQFDWAVGNSLLIENEDGTAGTIYYQARLGVINSETNVPLFSDPASGGGCVDGGADSGSYGCNFTAVAGISVLITSTTDPVTGAITNTFTYDPNGTTNFLKIYADTAQDSDDLAGTGFTDGTLILDATILEDGFKSSFSVPNPGATDDLDNVGTDNYPTVDTILGVGSTDLRADIFYSDPDYFLDTLGVVQVILTNTSQVLPYGSVNPSDQFSLDGVFGGATTTGASATGPINGFSTNKTVAQADANSSFELVQNEVPEPTSLLLLGSGLLGAAAARRRRAKKN